MKHVAAPFVLVSLLALSACGYDNVPTPKAADTPPAKTAEPPDTEAPTTKAIEIPSWAKVAPKQIAEAKKHGVPVAFENEIGMRFVLIPAGTFVMGSPEDEEGHAFMPGGGETQHEVTLTRPFYMQVTEMTNAQFRAWRSEHVTGVDESEAEDRPEPQLINANGDSQPAAGMTWQDAAGFAKWLSTSDPAHGYGLPTEAQWEYACRAGSTTVFSFGDTLTSEQANFNGYFPYGDPYGEESNEELFTILYPEGSPGECRDVTTPVGMFPANQWGLHDMHGNVQEWCQDWMALELTGPAKDPRGPSLGELRIVRGGSWFGVALEARSACRLWMPPLHGFSDAIGFRLVSPLPER